MGDGAGLRPKAGKQREEPPDANQQLLPRWTGFVTGRESWSWNWVEQTKEGCEVDFEGAHSPLSTTSRLPTMGLTVQVCTSWSCIHRAGVPLWGSRAAVITVYYAVCFLVARQKTVEPAAGEQETALSVISPRQWRDRLAW